MEAEASRGWNSLPTELVEMIFSFAEGDTVSLTASRFVCKQWRNHIPLPQRAVDFAFNAASAGQLNLLQWARQNGCTLDSSACAGASFGNQLETLKWLKEQQCLWNNQTCTIAARMGHFELLKWARERL